MKKSELKIPKVVRLPSGAYRTVVMIDGRRISITRDTEKECQAEAIAIKYREKLAEDRKRHGATTLREAVNNYIERRRDKESPATIKAYISYSQTKLQGYMDRSVYRMNDDQWQTAVDVEFRNLSPKYEKNVWSMFAAAIEEETGVRPDIELRKVAQSTRSFLEPDDVLRLVEAVKGQSAEIAILLELSSLRISEVLDVRGTDVDLKKNCIRIRGAAVYDVDGNLIHKDLNKNESSTRYIPIIPPLREVLESMTLTEDYLVKMSRNGVYKQINATCRRLGLPEVGNHGLRHSYASLAYYLRIPTKIAQLIGGWSDDGTMMKIYTHLAQRDIAKSAADFSNFFAK